MEDLSSNYLVETQKVWTRNPGNNYDNCILAINLDSSKFTPQKIELMSSWVEGKFNKCLVLIADSLYELSLQLFNPEWDKQQASSLTASKSQEMTQILSEQLQSQKQCDFKIMLSSVFQESSDYEEYRKSLELIYEKDSKFKSSVEKFSEGFLQFKQIPLSENNLARTNSYVLEDLSIIACVRQQGYKDLVYPGYLPLFVEIANGEYPQLISQLQELTYYELSVKS